MSRSSSIVELNLFPFLSVLVAVIGILILNLVSVITTRVIGLQDSGAVVPPGEIDEAQYREIDERVGRLRVQMARNKKTCRDLEQAVRELDSVLQTRDDAAALGWTAPEDAFPGLKLASPVEVRIVPDPARTDRRTPIPVEVTADGYVVRSERGSEQLPSLTRDDKPMRQFLERLDRDRDGSYLLLLMHPDGVINYRLLRALLTREFGQDVDVEGRKERASRIGVGVEPFDRDWLALPTIRRPS
jgi:hypothetical protein